MTHRLLFSLLILACWACGAEAPSTSNQRVAGEEDDLLNRYMSSLHVNPSTQAEKDENQIVNFLLDSLWDFRRTDSGIYYQIQQVGEGGYPERYHQVQVHYRGSFLDGQVFDSSYRKGQPATFTLAAVIPAWQEAIPMLQAGGRGTFLVPSGLAYGVKGVQDRVPPHSVLLFDVELLSFE